jgi:hypothetical protein
MFWQDSNKVSPKGRLRGEAPEVEAVVFHSKAFQSWDFWFQNKPSGNRAPPQG